MRGRATAVLFAVTLALTACSSDVPDEGNGGGIDEGSGTGEHSDFFDQAEFDRQLSLRDAEPEGPEGEPWAQALEPEFADTSQFASEGPYDLCFSNASVDNPWRQVGFKGMQAEVDAHPEIATFTVLDAEAQDEKQITDIQTLTGQGCDALIVSPNTTATLTPAVEAACGTGIPVIVFDRGVNTDCQATFIHPIGGYAFGADGAEFLTDNVDSGGNILALRILPGVDVLETRWSAAKEIFDAGDLNVVGVEFTDGDAAKTKSIVSDYIQQYGQIDGIWMDAGATSVAAIEAFEDEGVDVPPIVGEDQLDFLAKWSEDGLTAVAPTYPTYQWRTPIIAALQILAGEQVPVEWILPQPVITQDNLADYLDPEMPPLHYALCGCEEMGGYPGLWQ